MTTNRIGRQTIALTGIAGFFLFVFLYLFLFNRYHLLYLEQEQLFRYDQGYILDLLQNPGGFLEVVSAFLVQFFCDSWLASLIATGLFLWIFLLVRRILLHYQVNVFLLPFVPVLLLTAMVSNHNVSFSFVIGSLFLLLLVWGYLFFRSDRARFIAGISLFTAAYFLAGGFSMAFLVLIILDEGMQGKKEQWYRIVLYLFSGLLIPFLSWNFLYFMSWRDAWFRLLFPVNVPEIFYPSLLFLLYLPVVIILSSFLKRAGKAADRGWTLVRYASGGIVMGALIFMLFKISYDARNEKFLEIDYQVQQSDWDKVLRLSAAYPGKNQLVMYFTNLALYQTGRLGDQMFHYRQAGTKGLWLDWQRNETAPYYGGEIYYHLAYTNEAFRWAFEAMEAKGLNPRCLKRLVLTSLIHEDYALAEKYLSQLNKTLHYHHWANHYLSFVRRPRLSGTDPEIAGKRRLAVRKDFIAEINPYDIGLFNLLDNHPGNRMAFEYMMAAFLLNKNLKGIADNIYRLRELGYRRIPVHYEEALLLYMEITRTNVLPAGYAISSETQERFHQYAKTFAMYRDYPGMPHQALVKDFASTFWFYLQFGHQIPETDEE